MNWHLNIANIWQTRRYLYVDQWKGEICAGGCELDQEVALDHQIMSCHCVQQNTFWLAMKIELLLDGRQLSLMQYVHLTCRHLCKYAEAGIARSNARGISGQ